MSREQVLKSCPCCKGKAILKRDYFPYEKKQAYRIYCNNCFLRTAYYDTEQYAKKAWNRRIK